MDLDFDKVRWKLADELSIPEAELIVANKDKLNDEEKAAFSQVLLAAEPLSDNPLEDNINKAIDDPANQDPAAVITDPEKPSPPASQTPPPPPPAQAAPVVVPDNVITQDKLDSYLEGKRKEWEAEGKTAAEQKAKEQEIQQLFDAGYAPKDWNDYSNALLAKIAPMIKKDILDTLDARNKEFQDQQALVRKSQQEVYDKFEAEFATLAQNKMIPDPKEKPEEYKKVHDAIIALGDTHGKANVTDAYKLWAIIPVEHGGGLVVAPGTPLPPPPDPNARINAQKDAAGRIGSGRGAPGGKKGWAPPAAHIHSTRMEDLIEERLQQP